MSEAIRTCKRCGGRYTGWHCNSPQCRAAREKRNASARIRRMARGGGGRKLYHYSAVGSLSATLGTEPVAVYADACPKKSGRYDEGRSCVNEDADNAADMQHPTW